MTFKVKDYYYQKAKKENFLARSVYKLDEIDSKFKVIRKADSILDLGYYPGSWVQYSAKKVEQKGEIVGIDIQNVSIELKHLKNVKLFKKDIFEIKNLVDIDRLEKFDVVLSDMAPSTTGIKCVDQDRSLALVEKVIGILPDFLKFKGHFVIKIFDSHDAQMLIKNEIKKKFTSLHLFRPKSTRSVSKEFFVIGKEYLGT
ncbi:MAG: hypothetical protein A2381_10910 [Bdellovibrionales bacterium RIFOXYB1_FULL_37_110]|nr:MAG: hypothetical protein A2181_07050 [Bdellovibrionales bacterium RIFOXYA1_FULL_38_20]OFZ51174.1 MAG: hypothetical protein A2417_17895 [Bdellovibrionales bacterium RIFOXYC1_FULL_37_79]OFZ61280.1 MAG: hypothetical protein A2381_10910 [Bdellovibrionales bacterium RIFOXYB1_FULL_37_110]OFZ62143.1 MAG: hypothetical protein A2577_14485 [Bdellovibrionales bacterium RIFOXYD1_FULL_36_51]